MLRDLYMLQVHLRDFEGSTESARQLLQTKPGISAYWLSFAVSNTLVRALTTITS